MAFKISLHRCQLEIFNDNHRFKVVICGRRFGKTTLAAFYVILKCISQPNQTWWLVAPTFPMTGIIWRMIKKTILDEPDLRRMLKGGITRGIHEGEKYIEFANGSTIWAKSGDKPDNLRGEGLNGAVIDEAAMVKRDVWEQSLRPALADKQGECIFITTPKGKNWIYELYLRGLSEKFNQYVSFHFTTYDNPFIPPEEIEAARMELPDQVFEQEFLAQFIDGGGLVFRNFLNVIQPFDYTDDRVTIGEIATDIINEFNIAASDSYFSADEYTAMATPVNPQKLYIVGVDLAKHLDYTVAYVMDTETRECAAFYRWSKVDWNFQKPLITAISRKWNNAVLVIDSTGVGDPIAEDLAYMGVLVTPIKLTNANKGQLVVALNVMIENQYRYHNGIILPDIDELKEEFQTFGFDLLPSGTVRYAAPEGFHDDIVIAVCLAVHGIANGVSGCIGQFGPDTSKQYDQDDDRLVDWDEGSDDRGSAYDEDPDDRLTTASDILAKLRASV